MKRATLKKGWLFLFLFYPYPLPVAQLPVIMLGRCLAKPPMAIIPFQLYRSPTQGYFREGVYRANEGPCACRIRFWITHSGIIIVRGITWPSIGRHFGRVHIVRIRCTALAHWKWFWDHLVCTGCGHWSHPGILHISR